MTSDPIQTRPGNALEVMRERLDYLRAEHRNWEVTVPRRADALALAEHMVDEYAAAIDDAKHAIAVLEVTEEYA